MNRQQKFVVDPVIEIKDEGELANGEKYESTLDEELIAEMEGKSNPIRELKSRGSHC